MDLADFGRLVELDRRALSTAGRFVSGVGVDDLSRPTPCAGWTLGDLLRHMVAHNRGWALAARGAAGERSVWENAVLDDDPAGTFRESADLVTEAFADPALYERRLDVYGYGTFPASVALGMHMVDFLVHGWDVARAMGAPSSLDEDLSEAALAIALRWPYRRPDKAFDVRVAVAGSAGAGDRLVAYLGRSPSWPTPTPVPTSET
jgi:uncharacterized protein (TIGR03086 family)